MGSEAVHFSLKKKDELSTSFSPTKFYPTMNTLRPIIAAVTVILISITLSLFLSNHDNKPDDAVESEVIPLVGALGPESFAFHPVTAEGPYTGVSDGRIIKWNPAQRRWIDFAVTSPHRYDLYYLTSQLMLYLTRIRCFV